MNDNPLPIWNPFQKGYRENPYEQLRLLREQNPVHKGINGRWMLFKYEDVKLVLSSPAFRSFKLDEQLRAKNRFLSGNDNLDSVSSAVSKWLFFLDPPHHTELRGLVAKLWNYYEIQKFIEQTVAESIENLKQKERVEIVESFAVFVPTKIICKILGLPFEDYQQLRQWAKYFAKTLEPFESLPKLLKYNQNAREFYEYIEVIMEEKTHKADDSFISNFLIANQKLENPLNHSELVSIFIILFFAGIETSIYLFGQSVFYLINNPRQLQLLKNDLSLTRPAVEELIRYASPLQYAPRVALREIEVRGKIISAGEMVMGCVASANRDPEIFDNPEALDFTRTKNPHLSFGHGFHHCIGAKLARDEMNVAIPAFINAFSEIEFDQQNLYEWDENIINRGLKKLPVIWSKN